MNKKDLFEMSLHSEMIISRGTSILRVFGGWIYTQLIKTAEHTFTATSVFVPEQLNCDVKINS